MVAPAAPEVDGLSATVEGAGLPQQPSRAVPPGAAAAGSAEPSGSSGATESEASAAPPGANAAGVDQDSTAPPDADSAALMADREICVGPPGSGSQGQPVSGEHGARAPPQDATDGTLAGPPAAPLQPSPGAGQVAAGSGAPPAAPAQPAETGPSSAAARTSGYAEDRAHGPRGASLPAFASAANCALDASVHELEAQVPPRPTLPVLPAGLHSQLLCRALGGASCPGSLSGQLGARGANLPAAASATNSALEKTVHELGAQGRIPSPSCSGLSRSWISRHLVWWCWPGCWPCNLLVRCHATWGA